MIYHEVTALKNSFLYKCSAVLLSAVFVCSTLTEPARAAADQPNYIYALGGSDPYYSSQWGLENDGSIRYSYMLGGQRATASAIAGVDIGYADGIRIYEADPDPKSDTVVAVIDTGFDYTHEDLSAETWVNTDEIAGDGIDNDGNGFVDDVYGWDFTANQKQKNVTSSDYEHGTHCAGIIGAGSDNGTGITGIAGVSNVKLMSIKTLTGEDGVGTTDELIEAIHYAENNGADICNISLGTYEYDAPLYSVMKNSKMLFVCASGNDGVDCDSQPIYPACYDLPNIISVANVQVDGTLLYASNYGQSSIDLAAPGTYIYSTLPGNSYGYMSGTSMSAPFVTGVAALAHSYYSGISASQLADLIRSNVLQLRTLSGYVSSSGMVSLSSVLTAASTSAFAPDANAPAVAADIADSADSYKQTVTVTAADDSGVVTLRYARGVKTASYFSGKGTALTVDSASGTASFKVSIPGVYTICATDASGNQTLTQVTSTVDAPSVLTLSAARKTIYRGKTYKLKYTLNEGTNGRTVTFTSSNKSVATVSSTGRITAKRRGKATITVKTANGLKKTCVVTVK